jgi:hypothetical protein
VISWFFKLCFFTFNVCRYAPDAAMARERGTPLADAATIDAAILAATPPSKISPWAADASSPKPASVSEWFGSVLVGLYKLNAVGPWLENAGFQPSNL